MNGIMQSLVSEQAAKINNQRDQQIISQLEKFGYKFESKFHLIEFLKTRCRIETDGKLISLYADDRLVAKWWETIETKIEVKDGSVTATCIFGNPPKTN